MTTDQPKNSERILISIVRELCVELNIEMTTAFTDWIVRLSAPNGNRATIFGYDFGLNSSSAAHIADDKAATAATLEAFGVECVPHHLIFRPDFSRFSGQSSTYGHAAAILERLNFKIVCKNNRGTGGTHVYQAATVSELETALQRIFNVHYAAAISPYVESKNEYRVIMIDDQPTAVFAKIRPTITGDGKRTVAELIATMFPDRIADPKTIDMPPSRLRSVPSSNEEILLNWRHNLGQGAAPAFLTDKSLNERLCCIAYQSLQALGLRCGSVDILDAENNLPVLEVNNGIMVESLARSSVEGARLARSTYAMLIKKVLHIN